MPRRSTALPSSADIHDRVDPVLGMFPPSCTSNLCCVGRSLRKKTGGHERCEKIAALPPDVRKGSAFPHTRLNTKAFRLGRLPESHRLSAHQAAQPQQPVTAIFSPFHTPGPVVRSQPFRLFDQLGEICIVLLIAEVRRVAQDITIAKGWRQRNDPLHPGCGVR